MNKKSIENVLFCFNKDKVNKVKKKMPKNESVDKLAIFFSALSDHTRLKILFSLSHEKMCVCDISHVVGISLSAVSHQLRILRNLGLVKFENKGKMTFYSLADKEVIKLLAKYK